MVGLVEALTVGPVETLNNLQLFLYWKAKLDFFTFSKSRVRIEVRPTENDSTRLYKIGDISVVIRCS